MILSGSCSTATREQLEVYGAKAPSLHITAERAVAGGYNPVDLADWVLAQDAAPLIYATADPEVVKAAQAQFGTERTAHAIESFFAALKRILVARGLRRLVAAGGETSGAVVTGLGAKALEIGPRAAATVPLVRLGQTALALKSGNFGGGDFFAEALAMMEAQC